MIDASLYAFAALNTLSAVLQLASKPPRIFTGLLNTAAAIVCAVAASH